MLRMEEQQALLVAMQKKALSISGVPATVALSKSEPVLLTSFSLLQKALDSIQNMHPALRSRIRGYGYEVYVNTDMPDRKEMQKISSLRYSK